ncbi:nucleoside monophosphate kinase, partial [Eubacterium aggregans]
MRVVLLGPPGAGKGTQAKGIAEKFNISHISTGDLFRENLKNETPLGKKAKAYMDAGKLVPDELVIAIVEDRIIREDCKDGYLLDGFPRTVAQASALCAFNEKIGKLLDYAVNI